MAEYYIDAHCHLTDERVLGSQEKWLARARESSVEKMMIGGLDPSDWLRQSALKKLYPQQIITSFGLHPWWVEKLSELEIRTAMASLEDCVAGASAIGETGLDFHPKRNSECFLQQEKIFREHLQLAKQHSKPVILHLVRSHSRALEIIKQEGASHLQFLLHSFSGSKETAKQWLALGALLSFNGGMLHPVHGEKQKQVLLATPLHQVLFETDAPDQAWRADGKNEPCYVREIYEEASRTLQISLSELMQKVAENFSKIG